ncbi:hypothetical protein BJ508DRAFT_328523 [Ascobolus immersus RN42]|uniref:Uncharacterized protein n=1 Tax=Ascobolus immersus RN42 TaxID=1160509 RepID=A0A3N4I3N2_ASCIM|nr:hypothetical protein BJ508DRAFT_328523 [Ascobolus immersus RN42]
MPRQSKSSNAATTAAAAPARVPRAQKQTTTAVRSKRTQKAKAAGPIKQPRKSKKAPASTVEEAVEAAAVDEPRILRESRKRPRIDTPPPPTPAASESEPATPIQPPATKKRGRPKKNADKPAREAQDTPTPIPPAPNADKSRVRELELELEGMRADMAALRAGQQTSQEDPNPPKTPAQATTSVTSPGHPSKRGRLTEIDKDHWVDNHVLIPPTRGTKMWELMAEFEAFTNLFKSQPKKPTLDPTIHAGSPSLHADRATVNANPNPTSQCHTAGINGGVNPSLHAAAPSSRAFLLTGTTLLTGTDGLILTLHIEPDNCPRRGKLLVEAAGRSVPEAVIASKKKETPTDDQNRVLALATTVKAIYVATFCLNPFMSNKEIQETFLDIWKATGAIYDKKLKVVKPVPPFDSPVMYKIYRRQETERSRFVGVAQEYATHLVKETGYTPAQLAENNRFLVAPAFYDKEDLRPHYFTAPAPGHLAYDGVWLANTAKRHFKDALTSFVNAVCNPTLIVFVFSYTKGALWRMASGQKLNKDVHKRFFYELQELWDQRAKVSFSSDPPNGYEDCKTFCDYILRLSKQRMPLRETVDEVIKKRREKQNIKPFPRCVPSPPPDEVIQNNGAEEWLKGAVVRTGQCALDALEMEEKAEGDSVTMVRNFLKREFHEEYTEDELKASRSV